MVLLILIAFAQLVVSVLILGVLAEGAAGQQSQQIMAAQTIRAVQDQTIRAMRDAEAVVDAQSQPDVGR